MSMSDGTFLQQQHYTSLVSPKPLGRLTTLPPISPLPSVLHPTYDDDTSVPDIYLYPPDEDFLSIMEASKVDLNLLYSLCTSFNKHINYNHYIPTSVKHINKSPNPSE